MVSQRGESKIPILVSIAVILIIGYIGIKTLPPYIAYYSLDDEISQHLEMAKLNTPETLYSDIVNKAEELEIPLAAEDIQVEKIDEDNVEVYVYWVDVVDYGYGFKREIPFEISASTVRGSE